MNNENKHQSAGQNEDRRTGEKPLVSIITPVYNGVKYLEECIQSIVNQDHPCIEQIIIDGGSTDGTLDLILEYQKKYPAIITYISEPDSGVGDALNKGLRMVNGQIIGWLNADDRYEPDTFQTVLSFFKENPDSFFVFGNCDLIDNNGEVIGRQKTKDFNLKEIINEANYIPCPSAFYRREVIETVGDFEPLIGSDRDYWIRVGMTFPIHRIEEVLSSFRIHADSATTGSSNKIRMKHAQVDCITTRKYGGSIFSKYCRDYYRLLTTEKLRPILGFSYPLINRILRNIKDKPDGL
ncbi:glycosyltransferase family 2 protein [Chloroflexota bacterium]